MAQEKVLCIERQRSPGKDRSVIDLARQMSLGRQVIGISSDPDAWLPEVLVATAQERIVLSPLNAKCVSACKFGSDAVLMMCESGCTDKPSL